MTNTVACLYCAWLGYYQFRSSAVFEGLFQGLGADLPRATEIVVVHRAWLYPLIFGTLVAALCLKEAVIEDKRLSSIISCLLAVVAQFVAHWMMTLYYLPLFNLVNQLS